MKTTVINSEKELKDFVSKNRQNIKNINGVQFNEMYPMLFISNKHAYYYNVQSQSNQLLIAPFNIETIK